MHQSPSGSRTPSLHDALPICVAGRNVKGEEAVAGTVIDPYLVLAHMPPQPSVLARHDHSVVARYVVVRRVMATRAIVHRAVAHRAIVHRAVAQAETERGAIDLAIGRASRRGRGGARGDVSV